jgi:serine phosphatase RsbU (regulator of sigma subunit)
VRTNRPATVYRDRPAEWLAQAQPDEKLALDTVKAELLLPLPGRDRLMGLIALGPKKSEEPYTPTDLCVLQSVATQTGLALEVSELAHSLADEAAQRERINREIEIAREVQQRLFPQQLPEIPGLTLAGFCRPALGVGGDYYDLIELEDGRLGIAVGDVSGKGISAALLMASLRASLRGMTLERPLSPYEEQSLDLQPGDILVTYTDGISEAMTRDDEEWGEERMLEALEQARHASAENILQALFQAADQFTAAAPQHDDMTILIMKLEAVS